MQNIRILQQITGTVYRPVEKKKVFANVVWEHRQAI